MEDKNIIKQVRQNKRGAQKLLYEKYKRQWYTICLRYHRDSHDAADVLQNALIKIYTKIDSYDEKKGSFSAWSSKIIANESLMFLRKRKNLFSTDSIENANGLSDDNETPIDKLSCQELTKYIQALPIGYRTVFNLYVMEGYTHPEISNLLDITVGTSKSQLYKARKLLQRKIESSLLTEMK